MDPNKSKTRSRVGHILSGEDLLTANLLVLIIENLWIVLIPLSVAQLSNSFAPVKERFGPRSNEKTLPVGPTGTIDNLSRR